IWPLCRFPLRAGSVRDRRSAAIQLVREKFLLFALTVASSIITFMVQRKGGAVSSLDFSGLQQHVANAAVSYAAYLRCMLWPTTLEAFYSCPNWFPALPVAVIVLVLVVVSIAVFRVGARLPYLPVGWLWYLGTLIPVIGLVQVGSQSRADRYTYVPLVG